MPCSRKGLPSHRSHLQCWCALTAPFHPYLQILRLQAVYFLLHVPSGRPGLLLATSVLCGVRTFLDDGLRSIRQGLYNQRLTVLSIPPPRLPGRLNREASLYPINKMRGGIDGLNADRAVVIKINNADRRRIQVKPNKEVRVGTQSAT